ncbi:MAG: rRNA methyltransferase [Gallionellales bacterium 35-53-114]|jgi:TrmH family RNA methyltransferase|nr:MAG: rRNA methyltransferase [Gallionellales bacterium 35-53-114]OYZ64753.1 MAG: rRNA methyltransferase [Gallionellales bacterium 24-53-125]OZB07709.1 MAG: rRNA methyltransferase [Gallionellales bacterium 39-52-133]HQS58591.1 RNA methyltransferase [Gallionellaceae bacterium]HQS74932.1 RNA methyltransferase [Gallionellaceae bacterium]
MKHITSPDNPFYKELHKLSDSARQRSKAGRTLLDGAHLLAAYLASGKQPLHIIVTGAAQHDAEIQALLKKSGNVQVTQLDDALFAGLSELKTVSGILALIAVPQVVIPAKNSGFCLLLENIQDPGNLGSMLRSAAAAGCDAVFMSTACADAWSPRVLRAAMGGHFVLNLQEHADLPMVAREFGGSIFAASLSASTSLYASRLKGNTAFAIGNEGAGLTKELMELCQPVTIPMPGKVESLNAAAAAAVCLFEAVRQRA